MKTNPKSKLNLTRFSYESTGFKGWRVSVTRHGEIFTRYFSDRQYGSMKKAQAAAQECLQIFLKKLDETEVVSVKRKSKSGGKLVGVSESTYVKLATGETKVTWSAAWPENGKRKVVKFPVSKYGVRQAKQLAIAARKEAEERLNLNQKKSYRREDVMKLREFLASI